MSTKKNTMSKAALFLMAGITLGTSLWAQLKVGDNPTIINASAVLEAESTNKGLLIPRLNLTATNSNAPIGSWVQGLLVYNLANAGIAPNNVVANQFYYSNGSQWVAVGSGTGWGFTGNAGTTDGQNFLGTTDAVPLTFRVKNAQAGRIDSALANAFFGYLAGNANTTGSFNTVIGNNALRFNTTGISNTAIGASALDSNTTGNSNTATGSAALISNTQGGSNTANGASALRANTIGTNNTASGASALRFNTTGSSNTANGLGALRNNTTGNRNTAIGRDALLNNTTGGNNVALGNSALLANTTVSNLVAVGDSALRANNTGTANTSIGSKALENNTSGSSNTASGANALRFNATGGSNTAIGVGAGQGAVGVNFDQCTFIGANSSPTEARANVTMLGAGIGNAECTGDNQVLLGNTAITQIRAQVGSITTYSDARIKVNVQHNVKGLDFIMQLKPVSYQQDPALLQQIWNPAGYRQAFSPDYSEIRKKRFVGFLAQDVEKAALAAGFDFPGIDVPKTDTEVYTLRYVDFIMPLVKAMQEQQGMIQAQQGKMEWQQQEMMLQKKRMELQEQQIAELKNQNEILARQNAQFQADMQQIKAKLNL
ncbi:MAG: tail fiber domain-containing protein [Chitinophagaceae bacterium]|nr:tail fiber domain-containing protein [Chitinophagaceae bacterium]